ncbi:flavin reductase [Halosquirtibacter xylanolyticus]|uniref:flavin reductase n=1 Tax=Halosquirtibacter xylanolyticus TaxID=3374599 RepID=UPI0037495756|nr:flavin reductase [Prolixibacteraceae bacterium]
MSWKKLSALPKDQESQIVEAYMKPSYGIYIVSSSYDTKKSAYLANCVFQVSAYPPLFAVCSNKDNDTTRQIKESQRFAISVMTEALSPEQITTYGYNHSDVIDKFDKVEHTIENGVPIVTENCCAWFLCHVDKAIDIGTHIMFIGSIEDYALSNTEVSPLTYDMYQKMKHGFSPKNSPTHIDPEKKKKMEEAAKEQEEKKASGRKMRCEVCGYIYDEDDPEHEHTFDELSGEWVCPICNAPKEDFTEI